MLPGWLPAERTWSRPGSVRNMAVWQSWWQSVRTVAEAWPGKAALALGAVWAILQVVRASPGWFAALGVASLIWVVTVSVHVVVVHRRNRPAPNGSGIPPSSR